VTQRLAWQTVLALLGIILTSIILALSVPEVTTVERPAVGGTYIEGVLGYSEAINPILAPLVVQANAVDQDLSALVFNGLTSFDETGQISPCLALEWEVSEDGTVYEFKLRQDVTWHDGAPFTSSDVAFTVQAMQDPNYQGAPALGELWRNVTVELPDDYTVRFTLDEPFPSFLYYTTIGLLPAHLLSDVPAGELPQHEFSTEHPVGTGMFMVESVSPDQVVLVANPDFWGRAPFLDQVEFWFFGDWENLMVSYERGEIHGFHPSNQDQLSLLRQMPTLQLYSAQLAGYGLVYLNLDREEDPFFQNKEIRQALLYGLDRQSLIDTSLDGQGLIADSPIPSMSWAYDPSVRQYSYDPERAIGLLDASGWVDTDGDLIRDQDGVPLAFTLLASEDPAQTAMAQAMARQWRAIGVDASVRPVGAGLVPNYIRPRHFDAVLIEVVLTADPDPYPWWHSTQIGSQGLNFAGFANEEADVLMEEIRSSIDPQRRMELFHAFQQLFAEEVPSLLIYYPIYTYAVDTQVKQVQLSPLLHASDRFRNIADWYVETEEIVVSEENELDKIGE
jgi:peptide/nickel transport system substrate-binding protein